MNKSFYILEIDKVVNEVRRYLLTTSGKSRIQKLFFIKDINLLQEEHNKLNEMLNIVTQYGSLPLVANLNLNKLFKDIKNGKVVNEEQLFSLKNDLYNLKILENFIKKHNTEINYLKDYFTFIDLNFLYQDLDKVIDNNGIIRNDATAELQKIRHDLNNIDKKIKNKCNELIKIYGNIISSDGFTLKNGHFALPIYTNKKREIKGILLDISDSGLTSFIEPTEIVEIENEKNELLLAERDEISKILKRITDLIYLNKDKLIDNYIRIGEIDFLHARCLYGIQSNSIIVDINPEKIVELYDARHPLLNKDKVVPNTFLTTKEKKIVVISGPNAGGKTVSLKTIASLIYMNQLGFMIPAKTGSSLGVFNNVFVEIGDNQSIEKNLSTFSGHISSLSVIFKYINSNDILFIDELCNGTDPKEGSSLGIAIIDFLIKIGCIAFITSHYGDLKKFSLSNNKIMSGSMIFDEKKITPTFKFVSGVSGKSYGFLISKKFGLDKSILNEAESIYKKQYLAKNEIKSEVLEDKERKLLLLEENIKKEQEQIKILKDNLLKKENELNEKEKLIKDKKIRELDDYINDVKSEINDIYLEFNDKKDYEKTISKLNSLTNNKENEEFMIGDNVELVNSNTKGKIIRIDKNKIAISADGFVINTSINKIRKINNPLIKKDDKTQLDNLILNQKNLSHEINLIGYHVLEALDALEYYLSECHSLGYKEVKVIHGYGSGKLRTGIQDYLSKSKLVKNFKACDDNLGNGGATTVFLK